MPETTKAVPFLSDADIATRAKGAANHPAIHANEESYGMGARWSRKLYELELQRLRQLVEEARVAGTDFRDELVANDSGAGSSNVERSRMLNAWESFLAKLPKPPHN